MKPLLTASGLGAANLCNGKPKMEAGLGEIDRADSERGTRLHQYFLTGKSYDDLSIDDREMMEAADRYAEEFLTIFREASGIAADEPFEKFHEIAFEGRVPGHPDCIYSWRGGTIVAILDLKSGVSKQEEAPSNYQLACYSTLLYPKFPFDQCGVAIVQPGAFGPRLTYALYTEDQIDELRAEINRIADATEAEDAKRVPGAKQCAFCRAPAICPEYKATFMQIQPAAPAQLAVETLSNSDLEKVHIAIGYAKKIEKEVSAEMKARIAAGTLPGWALGNSGDTTELDDPEGLFSALNDRFDMKAAEFDDMRAMRFGQLEEWVATKQQISKDKAKKLVKEIAAPFVTLTAKEKKIVREKAARSIDV